MNFSGGYFFGDNVKYYGVRKMAWDQLWHALYEVNGRETWDRVSHRQAKNILREIAR